MRNVKKIVLVCALLALFPMVIPISLAGKSFAAGVLILQDRLTGVPLGKHLEILRDKEKRWTIKDVLTKKVSDGFTISKDSYPGFGFSESVYWCRFMVSNPGKKKTEWFLEVSYPHIDNITLYRIDRKGRILERRKAGDRLRFKEREIHNENFIFRLTEAPLSNSSYYLRFQTEGSMNIFLSAWTPEEFHINCNRKNIIQGLYYGAMLIMLVYNLFIFFSTLDRSFFYYVVYCLAFILFQFSMSGLAYKYLWPDLIWWENYNLPFFIFLCLVLVIQFSRSFLNIRDYMPRADSLLKIISILYLVLIPLIALINYRSILIASITAIVAISVLLLFITIRIMIMGNRSAIFYTITFATFWVGTIIYSMKLLSIVPDNVVTRWMLHSSSLVQVVLLSLGLADRINYMKSELEALNINLEKMVVDRTEELNTTLSVMEKKDKEVQLEFELAGNIQQGILPDMPFYYEGIKIDAFYKSMGKVGGDFYDIFHMKGGYLGLLIADASGHGMPAAFITALAKISFSEAIQSFLFPADIFKNVNNDLIETIKTDDFVTAFFVVISPTYDVFYSNASHQKALVLRKNDAEVEEWDTNGLFMGALSIADTMYEEGQDSLNYGDRILLYTDGLVESKNASGESFGINRVKNILVKSVSAPLDDVKGKIIQAWQEFTAGVDQTDDVTFVIVEIDPAYRDLIEYRDIGFRCLWQRKYDEAIVELQKALDINPNDEKSHLYIGECYLKNGNYSNAVTHLRQFLENNEIDANVWNNLARAYYNIKDYKSALKSSRKACQLRNNFIDAMVVNGLSLMRLGEVKEAEKTWARILLIDSDNEIASAQLDKIRNG